MYEVVPFKIHQLHPLLIIYVSIHFEAKMGHLP